MEDFAPLIIAVCTVALTALVEVVANIGGLRPIDKTLKALNSLDKERATPITHLKRERLEWQLSNNTRLVADPYSSLGIKACVVLIVLSFLWLIAYTILFFLSLEAPIYVINSALITLVVLFFTIVFITPLRKPHLSSESEEILSRILNLTLSGNCLTLRNAIELLIGEADTPETRNCLIVKFEILSQKRAIHGFDVTRCSANSEWTITSYGYLGDNAINYFFKKGESFSEQAKRYSIHKK